MNGPSHPRGEKRSGKLWIFAFMKTAMRNTVTQMRPDSDALTGCALKEDGSEGALARVTSSCLLCGVERVGMARLIMHG